MSGIRKETTVNSGKLPTLLHAVCRKPREEKGYKGKLTPRTVQDAYFVDADSAKSLETAKRWAQDWQHPKDEPEVVLNIPNTPVARVTLVDADERGEGGRALKVILTYGGDKHYFVDLREDVLYDLLLLKSTSALERSKDGEVRLLGPFQWGLLGNQMRLFWTGSELYQSLRQADTRRELTPIAAKDLVPGHIYRNKQNKYGLYIGTCKVKGTQHNNGTHQVWTTVGDYSWKDGPSELERLLKGHPLPSHNWEHAAFSKSAKYVEDCGAVPEATYTEYKKYLLFPDDGCDPVSGQWVLLKPAQLTWVTGGI
jgi:hypothetical protein